MRCTTDACSISATSRSRPPPPPTYQVQTGWGTYQIHAILATEEMSKIPALIACLDELDKREQPKWDDIAEFLRSHDWKLMMNELYFATQRSATGLDATGSKQWQEAVAGSAQSSEEPQYSKAEWFLRHDKRGSAHDAGRGCRQGAREVRPWVGAHHVQHDGARQPRFHIAPTQSKGSR
ncbi:MAG: hypothetical protein M3P13_11815 [Acidobacteriota bacterium]|nr:hypothetical protein [Actinomycetota bacterium]MDP9324313.1 hypothetical protein [Acidobacteriota bacterium]